MDNQINELKAILKRIKGIKQLIAEGHPTLTIDDIESMMSEIKVLNERINVIHNQLTKDEA